MWILAGPLRELDGVEDGLKLRVREGLAFVLDIRSRHHTHPGQGAPGQHPRVDQRPEENAQPLPVLGDRVRGRRRLVVRLSQLDDPDHGLAAVRLARAGIGRPPPDPVEERAYVGRGDIRESDVLAHDAGEQPQSVAALQDRLGIESGALKIPDVVRDRLGQARYGRRPWHRECPIDACVHAAILIDGVDHFAVTHRLHRSNPARNAAELGQWKSGRGAL